MLASFGSIINVINNLHNYTYFSLRFWINTKYNQDIIDYLEKKFNKKIIFNSKKRENIDLFLIVICCIYIYNKFIRKKIQEI